MGLSDRTQGIYHYLFDTVPEGTPTVPLKSWRENNRTTGRPSPVARLQAGSNLKQDIGKALSQVGPLSTIISRGDRVLVKPNYNSPDPPPASTDQAFLRAVIEILREAGAKVTIGESSGAVWRPTRNTFEHVGLYRLGKELGVPVIAFEEKGNDWVKIEINGRYVKWVTIARVAYDADRLVYLPCLKTHSLADFSGAIKLAFGCVHPGERRSYHGKLLQEKLAEVNLWRQPDLIITDGRKAFISGGPYKGQLANPGVILASRDQVAIDVEAIKVLAEYGAKTLPANPWTLPQIKTAVEAGLGKNI